MPTKASLLSSLQSFITGLVTTTKHRNANQAMVDFLMPSFVNISGSTWDLGLSRKARKIAASDVALTLSNVESGITEALFVFIQDATGGRTLTINGVSVVVNPDANSKTIVGVVHDGLELILASSHAGESTGGGGSTALATPTLTLTAAGSSQIDASWTNVDNEDGYTIELHSNPGFTGLISSASKGADVTTHPFTGLTPGTTYYGRVKAEGSGSYSDSAFGTDSETTEEAGPLHESQFTGTNGTNITAYVPEHGTPWTVLAGAFQIQSNKAQSSELSHIGTTLEGTNYSALIPINKTSGDLYLYLRATDTVNDHLIVVFTTTYVEMYNVVGGVAGAAIHQNLSTGVPNATDLTIQVALLNNKLTINRVGVETYFNDVTIPTSNLGDKFFLGLHGTIDSVIISPV